MEIRQTHTKEQRLCLSREMCQSIELLSMGAQELDQFLRELSEENPLFEVMPPKESWEKPMISAVVEGRVSLRSRSDTGGENSCHGETHELLADDLREQIMWMRVPEVMRRQLLYLCAELDSRGYLPVDAGDISVFGNSMNMYENAVKLFQSLEPAGVGARSLGECLCIQLRRIGMEDQLPYAICKDHLGELAKGRISAIAKGLDVDISDVDEARRLIAGLEPIPSNGFAGGDAVPYVIPDLEVVLDDGKLSAVSADRYMPSCGVCDFYARMAENERLTYEEREYFHAKLTQARWAVDCVYRRRDTLVACANAILERQKRFFEEGASVLAPMTMTELSEGLGVHPSTVSRAVKGKYISCKWGVYPLSFFFDRGIKGQDGATGRELISVMRELIAEERPEKPLSDRELAEELSCRGLKASRRTVTKYRGHAMIPAARDRRMG